MLYFNVLPWRESQRRKKVRLYRWWMCIGFCCGAIVSGILYYRERVLIRSYRSAIAVMQQHNDTMTEAYQRQQKDLGNHQQLMSRIEQMQSIVTANERNLSALVFIYLHRLQWVVVDRLTIGDNRVTISGFADDEHKVSQFLDALERSPLFTQARLVDMQSLGAKTDASMKHTFRITSAMSSSPQSRQNDEEY